MRVHVIGNLCRDTSFTVPRLPQAGETLVTASCRTGFGGKGLNQAVAAARAGADVVLHAAVGRGERAEIAEALSGERRLELRLVEGNAPTDTSVLLVRPDGESAVVSSCAAARGFDPLGAGALDLVEAGDILVLQGNLSLVATRGCLAAARRRRASTLLNASPLWDYAPLAWPDVDLLVANAQEATALAGLTDPHSCAAALIAGGAGGVAVTLGEKGVILRDAGGTLKVTAPQVAALDRMGAGDVFCGVLAGGLARDQGVAEALGRATAAASLSVSRAGAPAVCPTAAEIAALVPSRTIRGAP